MDLFQVDINSLYFPPAENAMPNGLLAYWGDLSVDRLRLAYRSGIFPWYSAGEPILWWSPDPRFVLFPEELKVSKSMRSYLNQKKFSVTFDHDFPAVISACAEVRRRGFPGTWITKEMRAAYVRLHEAGYAHSAEVWQGEELVGGVYGVALGKVFFGESMFTKVSNASKFGFIYLVRWLQENGFFLIDCQQETEHLASLGARSIPRKDFLAMLEQNARVNPEEASHWNRLT